MSTAYSRVTLVNGTRRVDLSLPDAVPLADVMPQLLRFCAPDERPDQPVSWTLGRLGGPSLRLTQTLRDAAVADGEVLEVRAPSTTVQPAYVEDVRDAIEDAVDESGRQWRPRTTVGFALVIAAVVLASVAILPEARQPRDAGAVGLAGVVAALAVLGSWWSDRNSYRGAAQLGVGVAVLWGGVGGWLASTFAGWPEPASLAAALAGSLAVAAFARGVTAVATAHLAATAVLCAAGLPIGVLALTGHSWLTAMRLDVVAAILVIGMLPRTSLTVGGLAREDYRVRNAGLVTAEQLARRIRESTNLLHGGIAGGSAVVVVAAIALIVAGSPVDSLLVLAVGLALILRSRVFSRIPHIVPLRVAGLAVLAAQAVHTARDSLATGPEVVAIAAALAAAFVVLSAVPLSDIARARVKQLLNLFEIVVVIAMIALAGAALGVNDWVGRVSG